MSIHVALRHVTDYQYDREVELSPQLVRLRPAPHCRTRILSYSQRVTPAGHFINWQQDPQGNYVARLTFPEQVRELRELCEHHKVPQETVVKWLKAASAPTFTDMPATAVLGCIGWIRKHYEQQKPEAA